MGTSTDNEPVRYSEDNPDHVPNPHWQSGIVDTTGTMGDTGNQINDISPVFDQAKADAFGKAAEALDDPDQDADKHVVLPEADLTREEAADKVREAAAETEDQRSPGYDNLDNDDTEGAALREHEGNAVQGGDDESDQDEELSFRTKAEAQAYAEKYDLEVDSSLHAEEYKAAVAEAARRS